eukprot:EG_transcript_32055
MDTVHHQIVGEHQHINRLRFSHARLAASIKHYVGQQTMAWQPKPNNFIKSMAASGSLLGSRSCKCCLELAVHAAWLQQFGVDGLGFFLSKMAHHKNFQQP